MRLAFVRSTLLVLAAMAYVSCARSESPPTTTSTSPTTKVTPQAGDSQVATRASIEVTAKLVEIPQGAIFKRDLYDYAAVLKYRVLTVHRGMVGGDTIYVGQYNPFKPRPEAADQRVKDIGGNLKAFRAGQVHHMALEVPIDDHFMGGIVNKYFDQGVGPIYWAVWTDLVSD